MKKNILRSIFASALFVSVLLSFNYSALATKTEVGKVCVNVTLYHCIWYNDDGSIDFWTFGRWVYPQ